MRCILCGSEIVDSDKCISLSGGDAHLDCWITRIFKRSGIDRELLGQFALLLDYALSQLNILREVISGRPHLKSRISIYEEIIAKEVDLMIRFVIDEILGGDEY